jgi:hypothetical protein
VKIDMVNDQLAGKEMAIGRYYLRQGQPLAAIGRFKAVIDNEAYQTTSHTPEALYRLVEAYLTVGLKQEATSNGAVLGFNYPGRSLVQPTPTSLLSEAACRRPTSPKTGPSAASWTAAHSGTALPPPGEFRRRPARRRPSSGRMASHPAGGQAEEEGVDWVASFRSGFRP